eukprot:PLAT292.1.p1 GENE.PLAT292.1~~PLAT292.1.p1  ORF type:complete len:1000 (+),score=400.29 PLAT292.1:39-3002(+)
MSASVLPAAAAPAASGELPGHWDEPAAASAYDSAAAAPPAAEARESADLPSSAPSGAGRRDVPLPGAALEEVAPPEAKHGGSGERGDDDCEGPPSTVSAARSSSHSEGSDGSHKLSLEREESHKLSIARASMSAKKEVARRSAEAKALAAASPTAGVRGGKLNPLPRQESALGKMTRVLCCRSARQWIHKERERSRRASIASTLWEPPTEYRDLFFPNKVFNPTHWGRRVWDTCILLMLLYVATVIPFRVAFVDGGECNPLHDGSICFSQPWFVLDFVLDLLFFVDIAVSFNTAFQTRLGALEWDRKRIALNYARTWLILDIVATFPVYLLTGSQANRLGRLARLPRVLRLFRMLRLIKLVRVIRLQQYFARLEQVLMMKPAFMRLMKFFFWVLMLIHLSSCIWYFLAALRDFDETTWVWRRYCFDELGDPLSDSNCFVASRDIVAAYLDGIYWSMATIATVGYGDIYAANNEERVASTVLMIVGVSFYAFTVSNLSSIMASIDIESNARLRKLEHLHRFTVMARLPRTLELRLRTYFRYRAFNSNASQLSAAQERALFDHMPPSLRAEVLHYVHRNIIAEIPFFEGKDPQFVSAVVSVLHPLRAAQGDVIIADGEHATDMYFLTNGRASVQDKVDGMPVVRYIEAGSYFGESAVTRTTYDITVRAETVCSMYSWPKREMKRIMEDYPNVAYSLRQLSKRRARHLWRRTGLQTLTAAALAGRSLAPSRLGDDDHSVIAGQEALEERLLALESAVADNGRRQQVILRQLDALLAASGGADGGSAADLAAARSTYLLPDDIGSPEELAAHTRARLSELSASKLESAEASRKEYTAASLASGLPADSLAAAVASLASPRRLAADAGAAEEEMDDDERTAATVPAYDDLHDMAASQSADFDLPSSRPASASVASRRRSLSMATDVDAALVAFEDGALLADEVDDVSSLLDGVSTPPPLLISDVDGDGSGADTPSIAVSAPPITLLRRRDIS